MNKYSGVFISASMGVLLGTLNGLYDKTWYPSILAILTFLIVAILMEVYIRFSKQSRGGKK
jgi:hypothetical protein